MKIKQTLRKRERLANVLHELFSAANAAQFYDGNFPPGVLFIPEICIRFRCNNRGNSSRSYAFDVQTRTAAQLTSK